MMATNVKYYENISIQPNTVQRTSKTVYELPRENLSVAELNRRSTSDRTKRRVAHEAWFPLPIITKPIVVEKPKLIRKKKLVFNKDGSVSHVVKTCKLRKLTETDVLKSERSQHSHSSSSTIKGRISISETTKRRLAENECLPLPVDTKPAVLKKEGSISHDVKPCKLRKLTEIDFLKSERAQHSHSSSSTIKGRTSISETTKRRLAENECLPLPVNTKPAVLKRDRSISHDVKPSKLRKLTETAVVPESERAQHSHSLSSTLEGRKSISDSTKRRLAENECLPLPVDTKPAVLKKEGSISHDVKPCKLRKLTETDVLKSERAQHSHSSSSTIKGRTSISETTKRRLAENECLPLPVDTKPAVLKKEGSISHDVKPCKLRKLTETDVLKSERAQHSHSSSSTIKGRTSISETTKRRLAENECLPLPVDTKPAVLKKEGPCKLRKLTETDVLKSERAQHSHSSSSTIKGRTSISETTKRRVAKKECLPLPVDTKPAVLKKEGSISHDVKPCKLRNLTETDVLKSERAQHSHSSSSTIKGRTSISETTKRRVAKKECLPLPVDTKPAVLKKEGLPREMLSGDKVTGKLTFDSTERSVADKECLPLPVVTKPAVAQQKKVPKMVLIKDGVNDQKEGRTTKDEFTQVDFMYEDPVSCPRRRPESREATLQIKNFVTKTVAAASLAFQQPTQNFRPSTYVPQRPQQFGTESVAAASFSFQQPAQNFRPSTYVPRRPQQFGTESVAAASFSFQQPAQNFGPSIYVPQRPQQFGMESVAPARFSLQQQLPEVYVGPAINWPFQPRPLSLIPGVAATADFGFTSPPPPRYYAGPAWFGVNGPPPLPSCVRFAYPPLPLRR